MKATVVGAVGGAVIAGLLVLVFGHEQTVLAQRPFGVEAGSELMALPATIDGGHQQITVIDPVKRVLAVYQIELTSGTITLKSVRNIFGDLQIDEFNGVSPLPREVRKQLENH